MAFEAGELRKIASGWQEQEKLRWNAQDIEDIVYFLRQTRRKL